MLHYSARRVLNIYRLVKDQVKRVAIFAAPSACSYQTREISATYKDNVSNTARVGGACVAEVAAYLHFVLRISTRNGKPTASSQHPG